MSTRARLVVIAKPGSRRPGISLAQGAIEVRVAAPARDGRANEAVRDALAAALSRPRTAVVLVRGTSTRVKTFEILGLDEAEARHRLAGEGHRAPTRSSHAV